MPSLYLLVSSLPGISLVIVGNYITFITDKTNKLVINYYTAYTQIFTTTGWVTGFPPLISLAVAVDDDINIVVVKVDSVGPRKG